ALTKNLDRIANGKAAAFDHLCQDPKVRVAIMRPELTDRIRIAFGGLRIHLCRRAPRDALHDPQDRAPHLDVLADPVALAPWLRSAEPNIRAKPAAVAAGTDLRFQVAQTAQADHADQLPALVAEHVSRHMMKSRGTAGLIRHK